jgi:hypothetical protein
MAAGFSRHNLEPYSPQNITDESDTIFGVAAWAPLTIGSECLTAASSAGATVPRFRFTGAVRRSRAAQSLLVFTGRGGAGAPLCETTHASHGFWAERRRMAKLDLQIKSLLKRNPMLARAACPSTLRVAGDVIGNFERPSESGACGYDLLGQSDTQRMLRIFCPRLSVAP